jgi:hypothetical protein
VIELVTGITIGIGIGDLAAIDGAAQSSRTGSANSVGEH